MPNKKEPLMNNIYLKIKELIIYNVLKPGDLITVNELAERFNVSKTPVRDGLNALKHEGLVEVLPYKGFLVSRLDANELLDLFSMRTILEVSAMEMAANKASEYWLGQLTELAEATPTGKEYSKEFMLTNYQFHIAIAQAGGNQYLVKFLSNVLTQLQRVLYTDLIHGDPSKMQREHLQLVECIRNKDGKGGKKLIIEQLTATQKRIFNERIDFRR